MAKSKPKTDMTAMITVRCTPAEHQRLKSEAILADASLNQHIKNKVLGGSPVLVYVVHRRGASLEVKTHEFRNDELASAFMRGVMDGQDSSIRVTKDYADVEEELATIPEIANEAADTQGT